MKMIKRNKKSIYWKPVIGYEDIYWVSDEGEVSNGSGVLLKPYITKSGRRIVSLYKNGKRERFAVYRLVLMAFVGPCPEGMVACHEDGNPSNDKLDNLRWDTMSGNHADKWKHGTQQTGERGPNTKLTWEDVYAIRSSKKIPAHIAKDFGISQTHVNRILLRNVWYDES